MKYKLKKVFISLKYGEGGKYYKYHWLQFRSNKIKLIKISNEGREYCSKSFDVKKHPDLYFDIIPKNFTEKEK